MNPDLAEAMARAISAYLDAISRRLYVLFGTSYLGYMVVREWRKAKVPRPWQRCVRPSFASTLSI